MNQKNKRLAWIIVSVVVFIFGVIVYYKFLQKVEPAQYGKKLTPSGYLPEVLEPGNHYIGFREELIRLDGSSHLISIPLSVTMKDTNVDGSSRIGLEMEFEVSLRYKLKSNAEIINVIFNDLQIKDNYLSGEQVFEVYGKTIVLNKVREILSTYTPEEALANRETISNRVSIEMKEVFKNKPLDVYDVIIPRMILPQLIQDRISANKERELRLAEAQAQQRIDLEKRDNEIILAQKEAEKRLIDAQAAGAENKILNEGLTDKVLELRKLELQKIYAEAWRSCMESEGKCGSNTIFMPFEAMQSTGAQMRMYQK